MRLARPKSGIAVHKDKYLGSFGHDLGARRTRCGSRIVLPMSQLLDLDLGVANLAFAILLLSREHCHEE